VLAYLQTLRWEQAWRPALQRPCSADLQVREMGAGL